MYMANNYSSIIDRYDNLGVEQSSGCMRYIPKRRSHIIDNFEISILLDDAERFLGIESIRVLKDFYDPNKLPISAGRSVEDIVDAFFESVE